jgi:anti-sigma factor RsiW
VTGCDHVRTELGGYVLEALEPAEAAAVREHLAHCSPCAAAHAELAGLPRLLALADGLYDTPPLPPAVEERVLDAVSRERAASEPAPPREHAARRRRRPRRALWVGAAAVAAASLAALAIALSSGGEHAYEVTLRPVAGTDARGRAELSGASGGTTLHLWVRNLPADPDVVYEVRCDAPGWTASAGTFRADTRGRAYVVLTTAARRGEYDAIRVVRRERERTTDVLSASLN